MGENRILAAYMARALRLAVIRGLYKTGTLNREEALELLNERLTPGDMNLPIIDDRDKLDFTDEQAVAWAEEIFTGLMDKDVK